MTTHNWQNNAECAGLDTEWWFPLGPTSNNQGPTKTALNICNQCPVKALCAQYVLDQWDTQEPIRHGIWAGVRITQTQGTKGKSHSLKEAHTKLQQIAQT